MGAASQTHSCWQSSPQGQLSKMSLIPGDLQVLSSATPLSLVSFPHQCPMCIWNDRCPWSPFPHPALLTQGHEGEDPMQDCKGLQFVLPRHQPWCEQHHAGSSASSGTSSELCCGWRNLLVFDAARGCLNICLSLCVLSPT